MDNKGKDRLDRDHRDESPSKRDASTGPIRPVFPIRSTSVQVDEKIAALIDSFEKRISRLQTHISGLETQIAELRNAKDKVRNALDDFLNVAELSEMLRGTLEPVKVAESMRASLKKFIEYDTIGIYLFNDGRTNLEPLGTISASLNRSTRSQYEEGVIDWVISERRPVVIPWVESFGETAEDAGKNLVVTPMIVAEQPLGVVLFSTTRAADAYSAYELKMLYFVVSHAAVAIQNSLRAQEINNSKDFLFNLLENAGDVIFAINQQGKFSYLNLHVEELGFQKSDLIGHHFKLVFKGQEIDHRIRSTLQHGSKQIFEFDAINDQGRKQQYAVNLVPLKNDSGQRIGALGIMHNITEVNRLQKKLLESERLAAYTQTVITLNHEINNPLTAVLGNIYLLEKDTAHLKDEKLNQRLKVIQDNCLRIQRVIKKLERIDELKTVSYLGKTKMVDLSGEDE
ncbi:MAG: PAS domain S-box protein [bacterium]|nr:PAS domain S-box protein [bacterium]